MVATVAGSGEWIARGVHKFTWGTMATGTVGQSFAAPQLPDKTVMVVGTFGAGGVCKIEGSNDPVSTSASAANWAPIVDPQGNLISFASAGAETLLDMSVRVRPRVTTGDGTTALTVTIVSSSFTR